MGFWEFLSEKSENLYKEIIKFNTSKNQLAMQN